MIVLSLDIIHIIEMNRVNTLFKGEVDFRSIEISVTNRFHSDSLEEKKISIHENSSRLKAIYQLKRENSIQWIILYNIHES